MGRLGMAPVRGMLDPGRSLGQRGLSVAAIQGLQIGTGLLGQLVLLLRWSPHFQTDLVLSLSSLPWLVSAAALLTGLEMALPAAINRTLAQRDQLEADRMVEQAGRLSLAVSTLAALVSGGIITGWAISAGLPTSLALWMGAAMGGQAIPGAMAGFWRGLLLTNDRLIRLRLGYLAASVVTLLGYAILPGPPALALPLTLLCAALVLALVTRLFSRDLFPPRQGTPLRPLESGTVTLLPALVALAAASGLVHLQALIERSAAMHLSTGTATALTAVSRGWDALVLLITAGCVMPVYARWSEGDRSSNWLQWSFSRTLLWSVLASTAVAAALVVARSWLQGWLAGGQAAQIVLALLPRFLLLAAVQPLVIKNYAQGTPWQPIIGSAVGLLLLLVFLRPLVGTWGIWGLGAGTALSVIPGLCYLVWREWRHR